jgi:hypothetical protein
MFKPLFMAAALCAASQAVSSANAAELTPLEKRWLAAAYPVLEYARSQQLPIDIVVQPQAGPDDVPLAMGFADKRCKLVMSLRGNPDAEKVLAGVAPDAQQELIEAMAAHEIAHCWRYAHGRLACAAGRLRRGRRRNRGRPIAAGGVESDARDAPRGRLCRPGRPGLDPPQPSHDYGRVHAWLDKVRAVQPVARSGHDTRVWVKLAADAGSFGPADQPFEDAAAMWKKGLLNDE